MAKITPLMEQYGKIKNEHKDKILFFRMGDFFEMFDKDAETAAPILNIALTYRNKSAGLKVKMCGVPHHSISVPISKLLSAGLHVAICDQMEPAAPGKNLVKRAVTRVLSPGMVYDLDSLDQLTPNYMMAFDKQSASFLDLSTGSAFYYEILERDDFFKLMEQFQPSELVVTSAQRKKYSQSLLCPSAQRKKYSQPPLSQSSQRNYANQLSEKPLLSPSAVFSVFDKSLSEQTLRLSPALRKYQSYPESAQRLLHYVYCMQGAESLKMLNSFEKLSLSRQMYCSRQLYSHLEVFKNYEGSSKNTLFSAVNRTKTPCGARLLKRRLKSPLIDQKEIEKRLDQIDLWISNSQLLEPARKILAQMGDGERKLGKTALPNCNARDILNVALWLDHGLELERILSNPSQRENALAANSQRENPAQSENAAQRETPKKAQALRDKIKHIISPSCPPLLKDGGSINKGVNPQLDEWIGLAQSAQSHLLEMEKREQSRLGIPSLKIRYNNVFGYYIEIRKIHSAKAPPHYRRKQTLVSAERYTTEELSALEEKILSARSKRIEMERKIFQDLRSEILEELPALMALSDKWSQIDVYASLAFLAIENKYVRPRFANHFHLKASRHPALEQQAFHEFVPNTIRSPAHQTLILTGPNMAGKSALMRQAALTVLLAQSACFVPAERAELPLFHKMFTRIGASDLLSRGLSTFMVEMRETAEILEKADDKSFIILDEIGRGTATFDGMSLAQSILEFLTAEKRPLLFSATHYQELTQLAKNNPSICNISMAVLEEKGGIRFLYLLREGPASKSYGVQVARLAGLPPSVVERASRLLYERESSALESSAQQLDLFKKDNDSQRENALAANSRHETASPRETALAANSQHETDSPRKNISPRETALAANSQRETDSPRETALAANSRHETASPRKNISSRENDSQIENALANNETQRESDSALAQSLIEEILEYPLMTQNPIEALSQIQKWQERVKQEKAGKELKIKPSSSSAPHLTNKVQ